MWPPPPRNLPAVIEKSVEGQYRPGPYWLPISGGLLPDGASWGWWQEGRDIIRAPAGSAMVEACVSAYSQTISMCPGNHWLLNDKNGRERVTTSALTRILRYPNDYQSISDFMLNAVRSLYVDGNAYALALRNSRFEINELHLMNSRMCQPQIAVDGSIFYNLGGNEVIDARIGGPLIVPARDVLHVRLHSSSNRLKGESPLAAAAQDIAIGSAMTQQQTAFFMNQARPSAVLTTDLTLDKEQAQQLRDRWDEQSQGLNQGKTPILSSGLKPMFLSSFSKDTEVVEIMKLSEQRIALAFRIPLQILGIGGTPFASTEALMQSWISSGLGFALNHIEEAIGLLFGLRGQPTEYVEFDTSALERSAFKDRIEAFVRSVQGGIHSPNNARNAFELDSVKDGDEPRVQQQVVPLSAAEAIPAAPPAPSAPPAKPAAEPAASKDFLDDELIRIRGRFRSSHVANSVVV